MYHVWLENKNSILLWSTYAIRLYIVSIVSCTDVWKGLLDKYVEL